MTTSTVLRADLTNCPNNGLIISADNITLDLNGHSVGGDAAPVRNCPEGALCDVGIVNAGGHVGVTIKGGSVTGFELGLLLVDADASRLRRLSVADNAGPGLLALSSAGIEVTGSLFTRNGLSTDSAGLAAIDVTDSLIAGNRMLRNGDAGLFTRNSDRNRYARNRMNGNLNVGIVIDGMRNTATGNVVRRNGAGVILIGDDNVVSHNLVADSLGCGDECGIGISLEGGRSNLVADNVVVRARRFGIRLDSFAGDADATVVRRNRVRAAGQDGIAVNAEGAGPVTATLLTGNRVTRSLDDGIDINSPSTEVRRNVANRNGDLGIEAVPGVQDGSGNRAAGNGNRAQCTHVHCA